MRRGGIVIALLAGSVGCATTGVGDGPAAPSQFPSRAALDKIAATPAPVKLAADPGVEADGWQLTGPLPDTIEPMQYSDGSPFQAILEEVAARRPGLVAMPASMHCVAQETGLFLLKKHALPAERLARFIAGRCGAVAADVQVTYSDAPAPERLSPERASEELRKLVLESLQRALKGGPQQAGIWFGQRDGRAAVVISVATRRANLDSLSIVPAGDGRVVVRGELLEAADHLEGVYNRGHFGFGRCVSDPSVALPRFQVTCAVDPTDASAWIEVAAFSAGRVLGHVVANLIVFPNGTPAAAYHDAGYVTRSVAAGADAREQLLALLNEVRRGAGLPEVALAARESEVATRVGPHYFAAVAGIESELNADAVVLGLRAGWEIEGDVLSGEFTAGALSNSDDLGRLLDYVLERPSGREALLGHATRLVALGPVLAPEQHIIALVASSYALFGGANHEADAKRVVGRLTKARIDQQMSAPLPLAAIDGYAQEAAGRVQRGELQPKRALERILQRSAERLPGVPFHGWVFEASSLDDVRFPRELIWYPIAGVTVSVTHYRPRNSPWSRLVVFIVVASTHGSGTSVSRPSHAM
ncbi:MAG: hypothetical protein JWN44_4306 [Myxococcales bacterium]|nr:hypothetical protein [Myxococcales bacterium]